MIIALSLMAFIVLLLTSLTTLLQVEQQASTSMNSRSAAQENAVLALQIALGELQRFAGPDQRVSTTADLLASTDINGNPTPDPLYSTSPRINVAPGTRYWTGIWGNGQRDIGYDMAPNAMPSDGDQGIRGMSPELLTWLISGNENASYTFNGNEGAVSSGFQGTFGPDSSVNFSDPDTPTIDGHPGVLMVGEGSVWDDNGDHQEWVVAPKVMLNASTGQEVGSYAWWIGDEGVKARVNLQNSYVRTGDRSDEKYSFFMAQRSGVEFMDGEVAGVAIGSDYDHENPAIARMAKVKELELTGASANAKSRLGDAATRHFHNLTADSFGVLSDTYAGGLKKDLTADIIDDSGNFSYRPNDSDPIFEPISRAEENLPTWGHLRTWARTHPDDEGKIDHEPASDENAGIAPVLNYFSLGFDIRVNGGLLNVHMYPVVALYNPYPVTIRAADYEVGYKFPEIDESNSNTVIEIFTGPEMSGTATEDDDIPFTVKALIDLTQFQLYQSGFSVVNNDPIYFTIKSLDLPPGESHIYYLSGTSNGAVYNPGMNLVRAPAGQDANPLHYCMMPGSGTIPMSATDDRYMVAITDMREREVYWGMRNYDSDGTVKADVILASVDNGGFANPDSYIHHSRDIQVDDVGTYPSGQIHFLVGQSDPVIDPITGQVISNGSTLRPPDGIPYKYGFRVDTTDTRFWAGNTEGPRSAIRYCGAGEQRGTYSSSYQVGMPQIDRIWLRHANHRAPIGGLTTSETDVPYYGYAMSAGNNAYGLAVSNDISGRDVNMFPKPKEYVLDMAGSPDASSPPRLAVFFDILEDAERLHSMAQFQHVPFARYTHMTSYPFANSYAEHRIPRRELYRSGSIPQLDGDDYAPLYDLSYLMNRALWDRFFISTVPSDYTQAQLDGFDPLPNSRMTPFASEENTKPDIDDLRGSSTNNDAYDKAAANLLNAGAFNINSTSEQAWRAVLAGTNGLPQNSDYASNGDNVDSIVPFPRFSRPLVSLGKEGPYHDYDDTMSLTTNNETDFLTDFYYGNRGLYLQDTEITTNDNPQNLVNELARTMVEQVRIRGPFLSLSDFVNRAMTDDNSEALGIKGALQAAIDGMETSQANPSDKWRSIRNGSIRTTALRYNGYDPIYPDYDVEQYLGGPMSEANGAQHKAPYLFQFANGPKYLTQADVLSAIGPSLAPRSDTFVIRAYGETQNPLTGEVEGRAWCEATVQRIPNFVDDSNEPELSLTDASLTDTNRKFGRKFEIVEFRWLDESEI
ncbi:MAG: hypothetical protein ACQKBV_13460 [Puniceicoccales bacterium]